MVSVFKKLLSVAWVALASTSYAQDFKGHVKLLNNLFVPYPDTLIWFSDQTIENRLEFKWSRYDKIKVEAHARNRFIYGDFVENIPRYAQLIDGNQGLINLSFLWADGHSFVGFTELDRLNAMLSIGQVELTLGRQRINWGMDLVWNPNDIFNTFSYLNLEYPERPGTDAVNLKVYTGSLSFIEAVYKPQKHTDSSAYGVRYRSNMAATDYQLIVARMPGHYVMGGGFTSELGLFAIRSEFSYFLREKSTNESGLVATLSADRSISNSGFIQLGILYNSFGSSKSFEPISLIEPRVQNPMMLSRGKVNLFASASTTIRTLFTPSLAILANPADGSAVVIPALSYSASNNLTLALTTILFTGSRAAEYQNTGQLMYFKVQWNF